MTQQTETVSTEQTQKTSSGMPVRIIGAGAVLLALIAVGTVPRLARQREALAAVREAPATHPVVTLIHAKRGEPTSELLLPGNIEPLYSANLYARVDGYLDRRNVDIGAKVRSGQVLAMISSPEVDQQLLQARATLAQSEASLQQAKAANITAAEANVTANRANVSRLQQMQSFERIVAPFDGVITERNVERGDLVSSGNSAVGKPLFSIAQSGTLRIQIDVPQSEAVNIKDGQKASIDVRERLGRPYTGTVIRNAGALNNAARTMLTEVQVDNRDASLMPGMYAQVKFTLSQQRTSLIIPTSSLVVDRGGMHVVTVDASHTIHFVPVTIGKDMGKEVEILKGIQGSESLVASPSDLLNEGEHVEVR